MARRVMLVRTWTPRCWVQSRQSITQSQERHGFGPSATPSRRCGECNTPQKCLILPFCHLGLPVLSMLTAGHVLRVQRVTLLTARTIPDFNTCSTIHIGSRIGESRTCVILGERLEQGRIEKRGCKSRNWNARGNDEYNALCSVSWMQV